MGRHVRIQAEHRTDDHIPNSHDHPTVVSTPKIRIRPCPPSLVLCMGLALYFGILYGEGAFAAEAESPRHNLSDIQSLLTPEEKRWLSEHPIIVVAGPKAFPPFHYYDQDGTWHGMASDYVQLIFRQLNIQLEARSNLSWSEVLHEAKAGRIDLIACLAKTTKREVYLHFSDPILSFPLVIIARAEAPFMSGLDDLNTQKVAFIKDEATVDWLQRDGIQTTPYIVKSPLEALKAVSLGRADAHIANMASATYLIQHQGLTNLKIAAPTAYGNYNLYMAVRKDWPELITILNKALANIWSQQHVTIRNRWIAVPNDFQIRKTAILKWIFSLGAIAILIIVVILLWNRRLSKEVSERQRAEATLLFTQFAIDHFSDAAFWMGPDARFIYVNKAACRALGYSKSELLSMSVHDIDPDFPEAAWLDHWAELKQKRSMVIKSHHRTKTGMVYPVEVSLNYIRFHDKEYNCAFARDISERQLVQRFMQMRLDLIEFAASHSIQDFLARALDEIGSLVDSPIGFFHLVQSDQKTLSLQQWSTRTLKEFCHTKGYGLHYDIKDAGVWVDCVHEKKPVIHNDYASLPHKKGLPEGHAEVVRELVVPVLRDNNVVAILGVGNKPNYYTQKDTDVVAYLADVTWTILFQKQSEELLQESESRYRGVVEDTPVLICSFQPEGEITYVNASYCKYFEQDRDELIGSNFLKLIPESEQEKVMANISKLSLDMPSQSHEHRVIAPGGEIRWQRWTNRALFDSDGYTVSYQAIGEDITEHHRAQQELEKASREWQTTFDAVNAAVWILDQDQRVIRSNKAAEQMYNLPMDELIGKHCWEIVHDLPNPYGQCPLPRARKNLQRETMEIKQNDDWFEVAIDPILNKDGEFVGAVHIVTNISKRKAAEHDKAQLHDQLVQSQKIESVGRLAGGVAHDFNNMLGVIIGHVELAMEQVDTTLPVHEDLSEIWKAAQRSADLTRQLLAFARRQTAIPRVLDLNDTVSGMLKMLRRLIGENIDLSWQPGANLWPVNIDPAQVDQVLANLCVNARDAIEGVGKIVIETRNMSLDQAFGTHRTEFVPGDYVMLAISDDGCGMTREVRDNIFEPFFTTKSSGKGTGLGLATVYGIIKQNNGYIDVYSEPDQGTSIKIYLSRSHKSIEARQASPPKKIATGTETVLLVEDEKSILRLAETILQRSGYTVLSARTPKEAIEVAKGHDQTLHLIVTDVVMPEMDGKELTDRIARTVPDIRVLFMSGYTSDVIMHRGILEGDVDFLQKPFSVKSLTEKVREVLDK